MTLVNEFPVVLLLITSLMMLLSGQTVIITMKKYNYIGFKWYDAGTNVSVFVPSACFSIEGGRFFYLQMLEFWVMLAAFCQEPNGTQIMDVARAPKTQIQG